MFTHKIVLLILFLSMTIGLGTKNEIDKNILKPEENGQIFDIAINVSLYERRVPQLEVQWKDNLPNDTSYNVIVNVENFTKCPEMPCSLYGVNKLKMNEKLLIPEKPSTIVDVMECSFMLGCNYTLTVETSNASVSKSKEIFIPNCILDVCSCQHANTLPKIKLEANMPTNETVKINWSINWNNGNNKSIENEKFEEMQAYKIFLKISQQSNPSLSWGGRLISLAEKIYSLKNLSYSSSNESWKGEFTIKTIREITSNAVLNLNSYIVDHLHCSGPPALLKMKAPNFNEINEDLIRKSFERENNVSILGILIVTCIAVVAVLLFMWRRNKKLKLKTQIEKDDQAVTPFAEGIEMEDNINYVDKYVAEAQANGLADAFELPHNSIEIENEIGEGAFGRVYRAIATNLRRMRGVTVVAVKQLKTNPSADEISEFLSEIEMLKSVGSHKNIVCFLGCCTIRPPYLMIMEYVGRGDLLTYLRTVRQCGTKTNSNNASYSSRKRINHTQTTPVKYIDLKTSTQSAESFHYNFHKERQSKPSEAETTYTDIYPEPEFEYVLNNNELHNFALQIANGMRFLEEQQIVHRDLAARNVLIDEWKVLKISDFGLSRYGIYTNTKTRRLPLRWLSIEAIRDNIYSNKSDVWAYGVVLWEIGTLGASPYPAISNHELIPYLISGKRLEKPEICTQQVYEIMLECWNEDPKERPTFQELFRILSPKTAYVDINSLSDDYVFPPIYQERRDDSNA